MQVYNLCNAASKDSERLIRGVQLLLRILVGNVACAREPSPRYPLTRLHFERVSRRIPLKPIMVRYVALCPQVSPTKEHGSSERPSARCVRRVVPPTAEHASRQVPVLDALHDPAGTSGPGHAPCAILADWVAWEPVHAELEDDVVRSKCGLHLLYRAPEGSVRATAGVCC